MTLARVMTSGDAAAVADLVAARLRDDARRNPFVNGDLDRARFADTMASAAPDTVVALRDGVIVGHLHGTILASDTYGRGAWVGPDAASGDDVDTLAELYALAGQSWVDAGALEHYVWVLDDPARTGTWIELGFARMHQRGVMDLPGLVARDLPAPYVARRGTIADLEWALELGAEIDRVQARGPSFSFDVGGDERAELTETLEDPEVRYFLAEYEGRPVAQCITFPLPHRRGSFDATLHLSAVAVREAHRGRGVATALVSGALARARRHGFSYVETNWRVTNRGAARFWSRFGFRATYVRLHRTVGAS